MKINIHPSALGNFNKKANELLGVVEEFAAEPSKRMGFHSDLHVSAFITGKDILGDIEIYSSDYHGNTIARFFHFNGRKYGLGGDNYGRLKDIAERLQSLPSIRRTLSRSFVEKTLFSWICRKYKGTDAPDLFIEYLDSEAGEVVQNITTWIPIANLEVETPFQVYRSEIRPLSKAVINNWENSISSLSVENRSNAYMLIKRIRKEYQGLAAVVTVIDAEPEYAFEYAIQEAQRITAVLGIFSDAMLIPDVKCVSNIKGSEHIEQATAFLESAEGRFSMCSSIMDKASARNWRLDQRGIREIREMGLDKISSLLESDSLNDFKKSILNSVFLYSKSAFTNDPVEKVVYILSSLESILLKHENEPIQQNLAERVAVFSSQKLDERKSLIKLIKSIYGIRSKYLHHGHISSDLELVSEFMLKVRVFFYQLLSNADLFLTQEEFVNAIDDDKLA